MAKDSDGSLVGLISRLCSIPGGAGGEGSPRDGKGTCKLEPPVEYELISPGPRFRRLVARMMAIPKTIGTARPAVMIPKLTEVASVVAPPCVGVAFSADCTVVGVLGVDDDPLFPPPLPMGAGVCSVTNMWGSTIAL